MSLVLLCLTKLACQLGGGTLTLLKTCAVSLGLRLSHLLALGIKLQAFFVYPTSRHFKRLPHFCLSSLLMPLRTYDGLATHIDIESSMSDHPFESVFLNLRPRSVGLRPLLRLELQLDLGTTPIDQGLALWGRDDDKVAIIVFSGHFPRTFIELC